MFWDFFLDMRWQDAEQLDNAMILLYSGDMLAMAMCEKNADFSVTPLDLRCGGRKIFTTQHNTTQHNTTL